MCLFAWGNKKLQSNIINLFFHFKMSSVSKLRVLEWLNDEGKVFPKNSRETRKRNNPHIPITLPKASMYEWLTSALFYQ